MGGGVRDFGVERKRLQLWFKTESHHHEPEVKRTGGLALIDMVQGTFQE